MKAKDLSNLVTLRTLKVLKILTLLKAPSADPYPLKNISSISLIITIVPSNKFIGSLK